MARGINTLVQSHIRCEDACGGRRREVRPGRPVGGYGSIAGEEGADHERDRQREEEPADTEQRHHGAGEAAKAGRLSTRSDASKYQYSFKEMVEGINATLDAVILPVQEGIGILTEMAKGI